MPLDTGSTQRIIKAIMAELSKGQKDRIPDMGDFFRVVSERRSRHAKD